MSTILLNIMFQENHILEKSSLQKHLNPFFNHHQRKRIQLWTQKEWILGYIEQQLIILIDFHNGMISWVNHHLNFQILTIQDTDLMIATLNLNHWFSTINMDYGWCSNKLNLKKFILSSQRYIKKEQTLIDQILEPLFTVKHLNNWPNLKKFIFLNQKFIKKGQTPISQTPEPLFTVKHLNNWLNLKKLVLLSQKFIKIEQTPISQTLELHFTDKIHLMIKILNSEFERNPISS